MSQGFGTRMGTEGGEVLGRFGERQIQDDKKEWKLWWIRMERNLKGMQCHAERFSLYPAYNRFF